MGEISINPKFNIHETYKKVRILNPYRNSGVVSPTSFEAETAAYMYEINIPDNTSPSMYTGLSNYELWVIIDTYFKGLKTNGLLNLGVFDYPMIGGTELTNRVNALNPNANALVWFGSWIHSIEGSKGNGSNTYAKTGAIPNSTIMTDSAGGAIVTSGTNNTPSSGDTYEFGAQQSASQSNIFTIRRSSGTGTNRGNLGRLYGTVYSSSDYYNALGIHAVNRVGQFAQFWRDGLNFDHSIDSGGIRPSIEVYVGAVNINGSPYGYSNQRFQGVIMHGGLTSSQMIAWMDLIKDREIALGRKTW